MTFDWWFRSCLLLICQDLRFCQAIAGGTSGYYCRSSLGNKSSFFFLSAFYSDSWIDALEQEPFDEFQDVTWKQPNSMRVPVSLRVATSHIRITSVSWLSPLDVLFLCMFYSSASTSTCCSRSCLPERRDHYFGRHRRHLQHFYWARYERVHSSTKTREH